MTFHKTVAARLSLLLCLIPVFVLSPARADITDELKACFDQDDVKESTKCLTKLRENDQINRKRPVTQAAKIIEPLAAEKQDGLSVNDHARDLREAIRDNLEPSYFTAGSGVHSGGDQTTTGMLYEAQLFQNFSWFEGPYAKEDPNRRWDFWLDIPIRIGLRQLTEQSYPVRTPTFNPGFRLYVARNDGTDVKAGAQYYSLGLHHYSNGQDGVEPDGARDTDKVKGSFNTNYVEAAVYRLNFHPYLRWARVAFRQHLYGTWEPIQNNQYPKRQLSLELHSSKFRFPPDIEGNEKDQTRRKWTAEMRLSETIGWGYGYVLRPGFELIDQSQKPIPGVKAGVRDKFNTTLEFSLKPPWWDELALYARYDNGYDYYNINFQNRINRLQFGVVVR